MTDKQKHKTPTPSSLSSLSHEVFGPFSDTAGSNGVATTPDSCIPTGAPPDFTGAVPYKSSFPSSSSLSPKANGSLSSAGRRGSHFLFGDGPPVLWVCD